MPSSYDELLSATLAHLRELKSRGERFVPVTPETWAMFQSSPSRTGAGATASATRRPAESAAVRLPAPGPRIEPPRPAPMPAESPAEIMPAPATAPGPQVSQPAPSLVPAVGAVERVGGGGAPVTGDARVVAMKELRERALVCVKCPNLVRARKNVVFGVGDIEARLMFVGEAPGADEDVQGEPFVGRAGQLLTRIIQTMGLSRETVYIANVLKCRPDTPGQASGNRKPTPEEMRTCLPYLTAQIDLIRPAAIVALGATAVEGLFGRSSVFITRLRGQWQDLRGIPVMPTYHPSYLLRNQALTTKREVWEDMLQVMERLGMPINDKHRGYFLKGAGEG